MQKDIKTYRDKRNISARRLPPIWARDLSRQWPPLAMDKGRVMDGGAGKNFPCIAQGARKVRWVDTTGQDLRAIGHTCIPYIRMDFYILALRSCMPASLSNRLALLSRITARSPSALIYLPICYQPQLKPCPVSDRASNGTREDRPRDCLACPTNQARV